MRKIKIDFSISLVIFFSSLSLFFLGLLAVIYGRHQVRKYYTCQIQISKQAGQDRLNEIEQLAQDEPLFYQARSMNWLHSWREKEVFPKTSTVCLENAQLPVPPWHEWFPAENQVFVDEMQKTAKDLEQLNLEWQTLLRSQDSFFQDLQIDVDKLCHLKGTRDRFQSLLEKVQKSCRNELENVGARISRKAKQCRLDYDNGNQHLIENQAEYRDNLSKGQGKWPEIAAQLETLLQTCPEVSLRKVAK